MSLNWDMVRAYYGLFHGHVWRFVFVTAGLSAVVVFAFMVGAAFLYARTQTVAISKEPEPVGIASPTNVEQPKPEPLPTAAIPKKSKSKANQAQPTEPLTSGSNHIPYPPKIPCASGTVIYNSNHVSVIESETKIIGGCGYGAYLENSQDILIDKPKNDIRPDPKQATQP